MTSESSSFLQGLSNNPTVQLKFQYCMAPDICELANFISCRAERTLILSAGRPQLTHPWRLKNVPAPLFTGSLLDLYFEHVKVHTKLVDPYVDGHNMEMHHVKDIFKYSEHPWNEKFHWGSLSYKEYSMVSYFIWMWNVFCDTCFFCYPITLTAMWCGRRWTAYIHISTCIVVECSTALLALCHLVRGLSKMPSYLRLNVNCSTLARWVRAVCLIAFGTCTWWRHVRHSIRLFSLRCITCMQISQAKEPS